MKREKSCGAVLVRRAVSGWETLLIRHANGGHWAFPKGHVEPGETEAQTALREIREETAIAASLWPGFRTVTPIPPGKGWSRKWCTSSPCPRAAALPASGRKFWTCAGFRRRKPLRSSPTPTTGRSGCRRSDICGNRLKSSALRGRAVGPSFFQQSATHPTHSHHMMALCYSL